MAIVEGDDNRDNIPLFMSMGCAMSSIPLANLEAIYHQADNNMYQNKEKRREFVNRDLSNFFNGNLLSKK